MSEGYVKRRPSGTRIAGILLESLAGWITRRPVSGAPGVVPLPHSSELRLVVIVLAVVEIVTAFLVSGMIPPGFKAVHALFETLLVLAALGAAATARHPHLVSSSELILRTGFLGELAVPRDSVRSVSPVLQTIKGRGPRAVAGDPDAMVCSVTSTVNVRVDLDPPVDIDLAGAGKRAVRRIYLSTDSPDAVRGVLRGNG
ncbi:hypothetical protein ABZ860_14855 [Microbispora sp. NPDC046973]|uniref:hypothetical protein n=1 Tax=Microbispora sp. NPDC046973 TaxID=3155022 RepID=UPI003408AA48